MLAHRMCVSEIVVLLDEGLHEGLLGRAANLPNIEGPELRETSRERRGGHVDLGDHRVAARLRATPSRRGQLQMAFPVKLKHQPTAERVARLTVLLRPLPRLSDLERERPSASSRATGDQLSEERDLAEADLASAISNNRIQLHERDTYRRD